MQRDFQRVLLDTVLNVMSMKIDMTNLVATNGVSAVGIKINWIFSYGI